MFTRPRTPHTWLACGFAALLALAPETSFATGADPATATTAQKNDAQKRFDQGRDHAAAKRYPEALAEFRASFEIVASPNTHFSIARTLASMGQLAEAYVEFGKTIAEARAAAPKDKRYTQTAEAADAEQGDLYGKLAFVTIKVEHADNATVQIGDRAIDRDALSGQIAVTPGPVVIVALSGGVEVARQAVTLGSADRRAIVLDPQAKPVEQPIGPEMPAEPPQVVAVDTSRAGLRTAAFVAGGVGVAGLATFAIFGALEKSKFNELNDACNGGPCPADRADDIAAGRSRQTIANVGLVTGLVGAAAGVVLFVVSSAKTPAAPQTAIMIAPGFVGVRGSL